jgi:hypothetical protein
MKCEGETVYAEPGKCPVCGMDLKAVEGGVVQKPYRMNIVTVPEIPDAGAPVQLVFRPAIIGDDSTDVPLDVVHEEKMHVVIVSEDLGWYTHIHPQYQADGSYTVNQVFPNGGVYIMFADYQPSGAGNQVERQTVAVTGISKVKQTFKDENLSTATDGYIVTLKPSQGKLITNNMLHLGVEVTKDGAPVTNFENIMGAKGHLVIISGDGQKYLHVHPDEVEGKLDLHTQFTDPGLYRAFFQFQTEGVLHTSSFTLNVKEGKAGELPSDHGHSHDHSHDHGEEGHEH